MNFFNLSQYIVDIIYENVPNISRSGNQLNFRCPICGDGKKARSKRGHFYLNNSSYYCFNGGCEANIHGMSGLMFLSRLLGISISDVKKELVQRAGADEELFKGAAPVIEAPKPQHAGLVQQKILDCEWDPSLPPFVQSIIDRRKLLDAPFLPNGFKFYFDKKEQRLAIPWGGDYYQLRAVTSEQEKKAKYKFPPEAKKPVFGLDNIDKSLGVVFLLEGVFDSIWVKNGAAVGSLTLSNYQQSLLDPLGCQLVYFMDNQHVDEASMAAAMRIFSSEPFIDVFVWPKEFKRFKDVNESIIASDEFIDVWSDLGFLKSRIAHGAKGKLLLRS